MDDDAVRDKKVANHLVVFIITLGATLLLIPYGASFIWETCNYTVNAIVLSARPLQEYGRCMTNVSYTSYDGHEHVGYVEAPCPGLPEQSDAVLTGCYNHYHPDKFEVCPRTRTVSRGVSLAVFSVGIAFFVFFVGNMLMLARM